MNRYQASIAVLIAIILVSSPAHLVHAQDDAAKLTAVLQSDAATFEKAKACQRLAVVGDAESVPALAELLDHEQLANYARYALEAIPDPAAATALRDAVGRVKGKRLVGVVHSLGRKRDAAAVSLMTPLLTDLDAAVSEASAIALGRIGNDQAADALTAAIKTAPADRLVSLANGCSNCAHVMVQDGRLEQALPLFDLIAGLDLPKPLVLAATLQKILAKEQDAEPILVELLDSEDDARFRLALQAMRRLQGESVQLLASRFDKLPPHRQVVAILTLDDVGGPIALPAALKAAQADDAEVRIQALGVLGRRGDAAVVPVLLDAAVDADSQVATAAREALAGIRNPEADAAIVGLLSSLDEATLLLAIELSGERGISQATQQLFTLADGPNATIRLAALQALGGTVSLDNLPKLINELAAAKTEDEKQTGREAVRVAVAGVPDREACAACLAEAMDGVGAEIRDYLLEQLAAVGGTKALEAVVVAARSDDESLQDAATRVLGTWMSADVAAPLLALVNDQSTSKHRIRLLRGYIRVARQLSVSHDETLEICRNVLQLADRDAERQLALDVLARLGTPEAQVLIYKVSEPDEETGFVPLFDGKTLQGWEGNLEMFRVRDGAIVGGSLTEPIPRNEFLCTEKEYGDFELRLQFKLLGEKPNAGVQIRSQRIPNHHEVCGYQADLGDGWWGCLYDESRRRRVLAGPTAADRDRPVTKNDWNDYRIRCEGKRIQLWINGVQTVDYTEDDPEIELEGIIGVQVHSGGPIEAWYRNLRIKPL